MFSKVKDAFRLYHITRFPKFLKIMFAIEITILFVAVIYLSNNHAYHLLSLLKGDIHHPMYNFVYSILPNFILPLIIYVTMLIFTQCNLSSFLNFNEKEIVLYKMLPNSFEKFRLNLYLTFSIVCIVLFIAFLLTWFVSSPTTKIVTIYEYGVMFPLCAILLYKGIRKETSYIIWDSASFTIFMTIYVFMMSNIKGLALVEYHSVLFAIGFVIACIFVAYIFLRKTVIVMKRGWFG